MNRENKKKSFEKNYYKTHPCNESFVCKNPSSVRSAAKPLYRQAQGAIIGTIARTVSPASIWTMNRETGRQAAAV